MLEYCISVPVGSYHPLLRDCLASLRAQTVPLQIALLDASGDPRVADLADHCNDCLSYRRHGPDGGQSAAILEGWDKLGGEVLGWLNADDVLLPGALEAVESRFATDPTPDIVFGHSQIVDDDGWFAGFHWNVSPSTDALPTSCTISQPSCFFKREAYERVGGLDRSLHYVMDWDLWIRLHRAGCSFGFLDEVLSSVLWSSDAKTGSLNSGRRKELMALIGSDHSIGARLNSMMGFFSHHVIEYVLPSRTKKSIRRRQCNKEAGPFRLGSGGTLVDTTVLPLFHYGDKPVRRVEIKFEATDASLEASVDGERLNSERIDEHTFVLTLNTGLVRNEKKSLQLNKLGIGDLYLDGMILRP